MSVDRRGGVLRTERSSASPRWGLWQRHWVRIGGRPFLDRCQVAQTPLFSVLLTRIYEPDDRSAPHDHSRWFASLILSGGYRETVYGDPGDLSCAWPREHRRWSLHVMRHDCAHSITDVTGPLRTLVFAGRHRGTWSFWTLAGKVDWKVYGVREADGEP